jgi:hypothetical protein
MMLCRTVVINFIYLETFTQAMQQISTGSGGMPMQHFQRRCQLKLGGGGGGNGLQSPILAPARRSTAVFDSRASRRINHLIVDVFCVSSATCP